MPRHASKILFALALSGCASSIPAAKAGPLELTKNNQPNATIVLQADAPAPLQQAAADLQRYIQKISGVQLPLKTDGQDVAGITLNIGKTAAARDSDLPDATLNPETYAITQRGDDVYFAGNNPSPTAFAVYSFLQDQLGVRWFAPGEDWEYVPSVAGKTNFTVDVKNVVSVPGTSPRIWSGHNWDADWKAWSLRNKAVVSEKVLRRNFQNNMYRIFPPSKYAETHPEYYPLIDGKRWIPKDDTYSYWWPATGNPDVQRITAEYIHQWFKDHPDEDSFSLGMDDIVYMSDDPLTNALDSSPDDYKKRSFSSRYYKFVNIIARQVAQTDPDKTIGTLIYNIALEPPKDVPKLEDNVFGFIANGSAAQWYQPGKKKQWMDNTNQWARRVKHLSRYDYFGMGTFAPRVFPHNMEEMMNVDHALGFEGSYTEIYTFLPQTAPMIWAFAQKQWNPDLKVDDLLNEFYADMYGPAAPTMKKYYDLMEESWNTPRAGHVGWVHRNIIAQATSIAPEAVTEGMNLLNAATKQAATPLEKKRVDVTRGGLQFASYPILEYALARKIANSPVSDATQAKQVADEIRQMGQLIGERTANWPRLMERQDLLGANLRALNAPLNGASYLQTDTNKLDNPVIPGILRLLDWYHTNQPAQASAVAQELTASLPAGGIRDAVNAWDWVQQNRAANLLKNGDCEDTAKNTAAAAQDDWGSKGVPVGWNSYNSLGNAKFSKAAGRTGNGIHIQSNIDPVRDNGLALQNVKLNPTSKYLGVAWVKLTDIDQISDGDTSLTLRFRTDKGWFAGKGAIVSTSAGPNSGWQQLIIASDVPAGATELAFMLGTRNGDAIFDDAALYEIPAQ